MAEFNYDNIDLFYYHAIDIEFSRLVSILENGIVSNHKAKELNLPYFYRNYKKASNRDYYVSISHFPNSILRYYKVDNELYNNSKNKITFILDGDISAITKQHCKKRYEYTNERHVYEGIDKENIVGILVSEYMLDKKLSEIPFNNGFTDEVFIYKKVFMIIKFFLDRFGVFYAKEHIYEIIGKIVEEKALDQKVDYTYLKNFMTFAISKTFEIILDKKDPTLKEALIYLIKDTYPIYIMNNYSIGPINSKLTERSEIFTNIDPSTANHLKYLEKKEKLELRMLKKVTDTGKDIYFGYVSGPLTKEDDEVIKTLKRKIEEI